MLRKLPSSRPLTMSGRKPNRRAQEAHPLPVRHPGDHGDHVEQVEERDLQTDRDAPHHRPAHVGKLIDASLMEAREAPDGPRFCMLGLVREYARRLLVERGEAALRVRSG